METYQVNLVVKQRDTIDQSKDSLKSGRILFRETAFEPQINTNTLIIIIMMKLLALLVLGLTAPVVVAQARIVGGTNSKPYPYFSLLYFRGFGGRVSQCGGSLIHDNIGT
jgi:hypothetical protein